MRGEDHGQAVSHRILVDADVTRLTAIHPVLRLPEVVPVVRGQDYLFDLEWAIFDTRKPLPKGVSVLRKIFPGLLQLLDPSGKSGKLRFRFRSLPRKPIQLRLGGRHQRSLG